MIQKYQDIHKGKTCLVIGNGPSLKDIPNSFLNKYPSFGSNRIYLKYVPTYYVAVNPLVIEQNKKEIEALDCVKFIRQGMMVSGEQLVSAPYKGFSKSPHKWIYEGYTVTYVSLQLAYFMGFKTVLLVGVDHRYTFDGGPNKENVMEGDDPNHFDPNYFKGQAWNNPDLIQSQFSYEMADMIYNADKRRIINLTKGTALDTFPKGNIEQW